MADTKLAGVRVSVSKSEMIVRTEKLDGMPQMNRPLGSAKAVEKKVLMCCVCHALPLLLAGARSPPGTEREAPSPSYEKIV